MPQLPVGLRAGAAALAALAAGQPPARPAREARVLMGTTAEVQALVPAEATAALEAAFAALARVDDSMSLWKPSELSALNEAGAAVVSGPLLDTLQVALDVARASGGAFDPTVEPLVRASGGLGGPRRRLGDQERRALLARVGWERVEVEAASRRVTLRDGARLDLGGVAKGYAVDLAVAELRAHGATAGLVDLGRSSVAAFGQPLTLDVADPVDERRPPWATLELADASLSSSSGAQQPGHILDPRSGRPARGLLGVTVLAASAAEADALSTAAFVLGPEAGRRLLQERGADGLLLLHDPRGRRLVLLTPGFRDRHELRLAPGVLARE